MMGESFATTVVAHCYFKSTTILLQKHHGIRQLIAGGVML